MVAAWVHLLRGCNYCVVAAWVWLLRGCNCGMGGVAAWHTGFIAPIIITILVTDMRTILGIVPPDGTSFIILLVLAIVFTIPWMGASVSAMCGWGLGGCVLLCFVADVAVLRCLQCVVGWVCVCNVCVGGWGCCAVLRS